MNKYAAIFALFALSVSQPLFDQYSKNMDFLVAWDITGFELFLIILTIYLLLPAVFIGLIELAYRMNKRLGITVENVFAYLLIAAIVLQILKQLSINPGLIFVPISAVIGFFYYQYELTKKYLAYFSVATILFPLLFVKSVVSTGYFNSANINIDADFESETPVVLIVYDELPTITLLNSKALLDEVRFPNFARFSKDAVWYLNAVTHSGETNIAVPAIISGVRKEHGTPPKFTNYQNNLFTLLSESHDLNVIETMTSLCPPELKCRQSLPIPKKIIGFSFDTQLILAHSTLPESITSNLPPINFKTHDFGYTLEEDEDAVIRDHNKFISSIKNYSGNKPPFFFMHNVIPHVPWVYLPSGKRYTTSKSSEVPGLNLQEENWGDNEWLVIQAYQRHILQTIYVDKMVGEIIKALEESGLYEKSMIIITADHGVSFWASQSRRGVTGNPESDIINIPLFVKYPNSVNDGFISYSKSSSRDILPTIAKVLGAKLNFDVDGKPLSIKKPRISVDNGI